jgi:ATP-binding cassette, subfamily B, multidrug efflux pump
MNGPMGQKKTIDKANDFKGTVKKLVNYLKDYHLQIILVLLLAVGSTTFAIVGPKILGNATTELFNGIMAKIAGTGSIDFTKIGIF